MFLHAYFRHNSDKCEIVQCILVLNASNLKKNPIYFSKELISILYEGLFICL